MRRSKEHSEACERQIIAQLGTGPQVNLVDDFSGTTLHILLYIAYVYMCSRVHTVLGNGRLNAGINQPFVH